MGRGNSGLSSKGGGGGGANNQQLSPVENFAKSIVDFFKKQVSVDIEKYRDNITKNFDNQNVINIDWNAIPKTEQQKLLQAISKSYSPFVAQKSGAWMWSIMRK